MGGGRDFGSAAPVPGNLDAGAQRRGRRGALMVGDLAQELATAVLAQPRVGPCHTR
jgi:hypothetical protein